MGSDPGGQIEAEGRRLARRALGSGDPLLLVNGYAAALLAFHGARSVNPVVIPISGKRNPGANASERKFRLGGTRRQVVVEDPCPSARPEQANRVNAVAIPRLEPPTRGL